MTITPAYALLSPAGTGVEERERTCGPFCRRRRVRAMAASEEFASRYTPADLHLKPYDFTRKPRGPVVRAAALLRAVVAPAHETLGGSDASACLVVLV